MHSTASRPCPSPGPISQSLGAGGDTEDWGWGTAKRHPEFHLTLLSICVLSLTPLLEVKNRA